MPRSTRRANAGAFLTEAEAQRLVAAYGSRIAAVLGDAESRADLGPAFGPELTGAEVRYLMAREWARFPDDILWRRSKLGLTMPAADREALAAFMAASERLEFCGISAPLAMLIVCWETAAVRKQARHQKHLGRRSP